VKPYYQHGGITIYHADCRELLPRLTGDLLCTDPPYGIDETRASRNANRCKLAKKIDYSSFNFDDSTPPSEWLFLLMREITQYQIIFGGNFFPLPPANCWLVWDKETGDNNFADCELAWTNFPIPIKRLKWRWAGMLQEDMERKERRVYPTQKPLAVMKWALTLAPEECKTVLDPFMGSGSTLLAAKALGMEATGIERNEKACELAAVRLGQEVFEWTTSDKPTAEPQKRQA
jgi:DNA modification methylase